MKVKDFCRQLRMKSVTGEVGMDKEINGIYICDLLSWVMSHAQKGDAWITVHTHINVIAVALLAEIPCVIVPESIKVEDATIKRAEKEGIAILSTDMTGYNVCTHAGELLKK